MRAPSRRWKQRALTKAIAHKTAAGLYAVYQTTHTGFQATWASSARLQTLLKVNQKDGFDCPSCAWPDPDGKRKMAEFCENGAKAVAYEATTATADARSVRPASDLRAAQAPRCIDSTSSGRITHPMVRRKGSDLYEPIAWDDAFSLIGRELRCARLARRGRLLHVGPGQQRGRLLVGLFARQFGTNNLPDCSNMCHESSGTGLTESIGIGKASVRIEDFEHADAIFVIGQNPGTNHPRMLTELQKAARNGCKIVSVNPLSRRA